MNHALGTVPVWQPVSARAIGADAGSGSEAERAEVERLAAQRGLLALRWPPAWPVDADPALRAAIYAQASGRVVAFALAALRQAFAAGRDLRELDSVLIAGAACELHPRAVLKGMESRAVRERLEAANAAAARRGVTTIPAVAVGERVFGGEAGLDQAAVAIGGA